MGIALSRKLPFHYGWVIVVCGFFVMLACLGLARFSYSMLLPPMSAALKIGYAERGFLSTGYFVGYLVSVITLPSLIGKFGSRRLVIGGLALIAATTALIASSGGFLAIMLLYSLTGIGSGLANIPVMSLLSRWFAPSLRGRVSGMIVGGIGAGIVLSGLFIPTLEQLQFIEGWRAGWYLVAFITVLISLLALALLKEQPSDIGLEPVGSQNTKASMSHTANISQEDERRLLAHFGLVYFLFGATYMIYGTFIVTTLVDQHGLSLDHAGSFWAIVGFISLFSGVLFGALSDRYGRKAGLMAAFLAQTISYSIVAADPTWQLLYLSIALFGISAWSIPAIMAAAMADHLGARRGPYGLSVITLFFATGQVFGPATAGIISDMTGSFSLSYGMAAIMTMIAIIIAAFLRRPTRQEGNTNRPNV